jgi:hypothetical protein
MPSYKVPRRRSDSPCVKYILPSKYCKADRDYKSLRDISDLVGVRIITYYSDDLDRIARIVAGEFAQLDPMEDKRKGNPDTFGYSAIHMDCAYLPERIASTEYKRFAKARFEIQITTILGHAWAEMHHPWYDELNSPTEEVRRFHRLAAVLELAEQEFLEIRTKKDQRERSASVRVAANTPGIPVTPEALKAFIEQNEFVNKLDLEFLSASGAGSLTEPSGNYISLAARLVNAVGISTIQELEGRLKGSGAKALQFLSWRRAGRVAKTMSTLPKGLSIVHLANFLATSSGVDAYKKFCDQLELAAPDDADLANLVAAAEEISQGRAPQEFGRNVGH